MKFKNKLDYENQRKVAMDNAVALKNEGKFEEAEEMLNKVESLDNDWQEDAKELANKSALEDRFKALDMSNKSVSVSGCVDGGTINMGAELDNEKIYVNAWAKDMLGQQMTVEEKNSFDMVNAALSTQTTGVLIPETVTAGIWKEIGEQYPLWNDVAKTHVKGTLTMIKGETSSNAKWYDESTEIEEGNETFGKLTLSGCELARCVTVTWKLKEMAIEEFIPYIQSQLAEKIGAALGYGVATGKGKPGKSDSFKEEPKGIITELEAEESTPRVITYSDSDPVNYKKLTGVMAKIKSGYAKGMSLYANNSTIWNVLANVVDSTGKPYFVPDAESGGVGRIFGKVVKEDDSIPEGGMLFANANKGYHVNFNKQVTLDNEDHKKKRVTDYIAYGIVDGDVITSNAFAYLKKAQA